MTILNYPFPSLLALRFHVVKLRKASRLYVRLSHCSHSNYFNNVFNFWAGQFRSLKKPMEEWSSSQIQSKNILIIWNNMRVSHYWQNFHFGLN